MPSEQPFKTFVANAPIVFHLVDSDLHVCNRGILKSSAPADPHSLWSKGVGLGAIGGVLYILQWRFVSAARLLPRKWMQCIRCLACIYWFCDSFRVSALGSPLGFWYESRDNAIPITPLIVIQSEIPTQLITFLMTLFCVCIHPVDISIANLPDADGICLSPLCQVTEYLHTFGQVRDK